MLTLEALTVRAGDFALSADLSLDAPGRVAVIGPSGAGKSTLLDAVAGFRTPASGRVLWNGLDITGLPPGKRPVATLFQDNNLFPHLSLDENLALAIRPRGGRLDKSEAQRRDAALSRVGLGGFGQRRPGEVSGGQQSRAALARVILQNRPVMLLDEPFAALGPALKAEMLSEVRRVADEMGALALIVTHDPGDARRFAERTVVVAEGRAAPARPTEELFADPPPALRDYLGT
ncbi:thiamine ABC transporter ATP-binding protein [Roseivivax halodurans JCM 10272]|uniref:Thiamine ABC transporter ATP-binding protein n=1 Tax=Roseivivax halodurans JCM 10272 TaxID=1449350 RepID=X7EJA1_9RHOB|nr:ATP-binding cassette domain-containing protein [Roseivivax halodurans]ETX15241.1 thiamine ABC transporter ATP-binding protein [Roseivivax halodurans JCM 10272]